eukprot:616286-Lingulodinium_polyedra.AAC.1
MVRVLTDQHPASDCDVSSEPGTRRSSAITPELGNSRQCHRHVAAPTDSNALRRQATYTSDSDNISERVPEAR